jgi:hypothetical protein
MRFTPILVGSPTKKLFIPNNDFARRGVNGPPRPSEGAKIRADAGGSAPLSLPIRRS